jgi:glycosyltransferase involved in cell wall biosynthesis
MIILVLHSRYSSSSVSGENRSVDDEIRLLRSAGHEVVDWQPSVADERRSSIRRGTDVVWSRSATSRVRDLVHEVRPDIVHCHNLTPTLSPAVLRVATTYGAKVVVALRNYRYLCLPAVLLRDGRICEACVGRIPWRGVVHRCYRGSFPGSAAVAGSLAFHRSIRTLAHVTLYLAVSSFVRDKYIEAGFPEERIRVKRNFAWPAKRREGPGRYFLYIGRLSREKGVAELLRVWRPAYGELLVVGDGPEAASLGRSLPSNAYLRPPVDPDEVGELVAGARAVIAPSICYEAAGRTVIEAAAAGVPAIASNLGGLPESVRHGETGLVLSPQDRQGWNGAIERLLDDRESQRLGAGAFRLWRDTFAPEHAIAALESAYAEVTAAHVDSC